MSKITIRKVIDRDMQFASELNATFTVSKKNAEDVLEQFMDAKYSAICIEVEVNGKVNSFHLVSKDHIVNLDISHE